MDTTEEKERNIIRDLAIRVAELAHSEENAYRQKLWLARYHYDHAATWENLKRMNELLGDILPVKQNCSLPGPADENQVYIGISDTGKGISPEDLPRIYDPGFTTQSGGVGKGLGLSIVYNIIQKHNGRIQVDSEVGEGTKVTVILPTEQIRSN